MDSCFLSDERNLDDIGYLFCSPRFFSYDICALVISVLDFTSGTNHNGDLQYGNNACSEESVFFCVLEGVFEGKDPELCSGRSVIRCSPLRHFIDKIFVVHSIMLDLKYFTSRTNHRDLRLEHDVPIT
ncbi:hypothetical protein FQR65_LT00430 [Abscondita terminalis]|nr:hypothetical protein FQR65_LT00430 [Abscondita terminalis]